MSMPSSRIEASNDSSSSPDVLLFHLTLLVFNYMTSYPREPTLPRATYSRSLDKAATAAQHLRAWGKRTNTACASVDQHALCDCIVTPPGKYGEIESLQPGRPESLLTSVRAMRHSPAMALLTVSPRREHVNAVTTRAGQTQSRAHQ
jgi:hypothetical protein